MPDMSETEDEDRRRGRRRSRRRRSRNAENSPSPSSASTVPPGSSTYSVDTATDEVKRSAPSTDGAYPSPGAAQPCQEASTANSSSSKLTRRRDGHQSERLEPSRTTKSDSRSKDNEERGRTDGVRSVTREVGTALLLGSAVGLGFAIAATIAERTRTSTAQGRGSPRSRPDADVPRHRGDAGRRRNRQLYPIDGRGRPDSRDDDGRDRRTLRSRSHPRR